MSIDQVLGLVTGVLFGFLLQKGRVLRFDKQVGAMLLQDMTIFKFMLSAILVGMVGIQLLAGAGIIALEPQGHEPRRRGGWWRPVRLRLGSDGVLSRHLHRGSGRRALACGVRHCRHGWRGRRSMPSFILFLNRRFWHGKTSGRSGCLTSWAFLPG
jgi:hypothetical protein